MKIALRRIHQDTLHEHNEMKRLGDSHAYLDVRHIDQPKEHRFPNITACREQVWTVEDMIPVYRQHITCAAASLPTIMEPPALKDCMPLAR